MDAVVAHGDVVAGTVRGMSDENPYADHGPGSGRLFSLDVTKPDSIASGVAEALEWMGGVDVVVNNAGRSEEHTSELQSLMRISYAVFCLKKKKINIEPMIS